MPPVSVLDLSPAAAGSGEAPALLAEAFSLKPREVASLATAP